MGLVRDGHDWVFDPEFIEQAVELVEKGATASSALTQLGVPPMTAVRWLRNGGHPKYQRRDESGNVVLPPEGQKYTVYHWLVNAISVAESKAINGISHKLFERAVNDGNLALKLLKARQPDEWSEQRPVVVNTPPQVLSITYDDWRKIQDQGEVRQEEANQHVED